MRKVNTIIQQLKKAYDIHAEAFHEYFTNSFNKSLIVNSLNNQLLEYDATVLNRFIDKCVYYRLGISDVQPNKNEIIYDLSSTSSPEDFDQSTFDIFSELVYCAYPVKLINKLRGQLEAFDLPADVVELITSKLETSNE